ncbi:MAG: hypothetical protein RLY71_2308 [Pseudomonadota bacterium]|jgi:hypothetical protein
MTPRRRMPRICRRFVARAVVYGIEAFVIFLVAMAAGLELARLA